MNTLAALLAASFIAGSAMSSVLAPAIPARPQINDAATLWAMLNADVLTLQSKTYLLSCATPAVTDVLYSELMAQLRDNPSMEVKGWQVALLTDYGEAIHISRTWPDGHELTMEETKVLLDMLAFPKHGRMISPKELLAKKGIITREYWAPGKRAHKAP